MIRALSCLRLSSAADTQRTLLRHANSVVSQHAASCYKRQNCSALENSSSNMHTKNPPLQCFQPSLQLSTDSLPEKPQDDPHIASDQQQDDPHIASDQQQDNLCLASGHQQDGPHIASDEQQDDTRPAEKFSLSICALQQPLWVLKQKKMGPVAVAVSGGVDSAVAAMLLKQAG